MKKLYLLITFLVISYSFSQKKEISLEITENIIETNKREKMKVSHILYRVKNLDNAVKRFINQGFTVDYGEKKNPFNALIYFSEGPYLELLGDKRIPRIGEFFLKLFGKGGVVKRIRHYNNADEGLLDVCLENYKTNLNTEKNILKKNNQKFFEKKSNGRLDTKNRKLDCRSLFPYELKLPFLMTYFTIDPKPKNFVHKNGISRIKSISFGTDEKLIPLINELCDDETLKLFIGKGVKDLIYEKNN